MAVLRFRPNSPLGKILLFGANNRFLKWYRSSFWHFVIATSIIVAGAEATVFAIHNHLPPFKALLAFLLGLPFGALAAAMIWGPMQLTRENARYELQQHLEQESKK